MTLEQEKERDRKIINWIRREVHAAAAMQGLLSDANVRSGAYLHVARNAYEIADAMVSVGGPVPE